MAGKKGCPYGHIVRSVLFEYWKEHDELIDYFMYDQIINLCYENSDVVKQLIDSVPQNNPNVDFFKNRYNESFDKEEWEKVTKSTSVFKLSYKEQIDETKMNTYYTTVVTPPPYLNKRIVKISCPRFLGILKEAA